MMCNQAEFVLAKRGGMTEEGWEALKEANPVIKKYGEYNPMKLEHQKIADDIWIIWSIIWRHTWY